MPDNKAVEPVKIPKNSFLGLTLQTLKDSANVKSDLEKIQSKAEKIENILKEKDFKVNANDVVKPVNDMGEFALRVTELAKATQIEGDENFKLGFFDRVGITFMFLGIMQLIPVAETLLKLDKEVQLTEGTIAVIAGRLAKAFAKVALVVSKRPNLGGFGILTTFGSAVGFIDIGIALIRNNKLYNAFKEFYFGRMRKEFVVFPQQVLQKAQNIKELSLPARALMNAYKGLRFVFSKVRVLVKAIFAASRKEETNQQTESVQIIQEDAMSSVLGKIIKFILGTAALSFLMAVSYKFLSEATGTNFLKTLAEKDTPFKGLFQALLNAYNKFDAKINEWFKNEGGTKGTEEVAKEPEKEQKPPEKPPEGSTEEAPSI